MWNLKRVWTTIHLKYKLGIAVIFEKENGNSNFLVTLKKLLTKNDEKADKNRK